MSVQLPVQLTSSYRPATASYPPSSPASSYMYRSRPDGGQAGRLVAVLETCSRPRGSAVGSVCVATVYGLPWCVGRCENPRDCTAAPYPLYRAPLPAPISRADIMSSEEPPAMARISQTTGLWGSPGSNPSRLPSPPVDYGKNLK
jgi:hypothetical protein